MEFYISFFLTNLIGDFSEVNLLSKLFKIGLKKIEIFLLMVFSVVPTLVYIFCSVHFMWFVLMKFGFYLFFSVFATDGIKLKEIMSILAFSIILMFSVFGFGEFFILFVNAVFLNFSGKTIPSIFHFIISFALVVYFVLLNLFFKKLSKRKKMKNFLSKVSFFLFGRHIEITGLIDSGNTLCDTKTKKPVVVVPLSVLSKFLSESECGMIRDRRYFGLDVSGELEYETVSGKGKMPIVDIGEAKIERNGEVLPYKCVLGIISSNLADEKKYECLLGSDFL